MKTLSLAVRFVTATPVAMFVLATAVGAQLSILDNNPQLKQKLLDWERAAPPNISSEIKLLRNGDAIDKAYAAGRLGGSEAKGAILALIETLEDTTPLQWKKPTRLNPNPMWGSDTSPQNEASKALVKIGEPAVEPLFAVLKYESVIEPQHTMDSVIKTAVWALVEIKGPGAADLLIATLKDKWIPKHTARKLGELRDPRAVEPLIDALTNDENPDTRTAAAWALGEINDSRAVEPLIAALKKDRNPDIRQEASAALGKLKDPRAVESLIVALRKDKYYVIRYNAACALGEIKDPRAVEPLTSALKSKDNDVRQAAAGALEKIQGNPK